MKCDNLVTLNKLNSYVIWKHHEMNETIWIELAWKMEVLINLKLAWKLAIGKIIIVTFDINSSKNTKGS